MSDKYENTETFRRWWKDVAEYCECSPQFPVCTFVFKQIREYRESIDGDLEYIAFIEAVDNSLPSDMGKFAVRWEASIADRGLLDALKHVMQGKSSDIVNQLSARGGGFELLRLLALKYDPVMPNLFQMLMASIYGLANDKCKAFGETVARVAHIERVSDDMAEQC